MFDHPLGLGKEAVVFKRTASQASADLPDAAAAGSTAGPAGDAGKVPEKAPQLSITTSSESHDLQGYLYCAALGIHRAVASVDNARDADYLFSALANLQQLAMKMHVADADAADINQWKAAAETRMRTLRKNASLKSSMPKPIVQIDATVCEQEERREIA